MTFKKEKRKETQTYDVEVVYCDTCKKKIYEMALRDMGMGEKRDTRKTFWGLHLDNRENGKPIQYYFCSKKCVNKFKLK